MLVDAMILEGKAVEWMLNYLPRKKEVTPTVDERDLLFVKSSLQSIRKKCGLLKGLVDELLDIDCELFSKPDRDYCQRVEGPKVVVGKTVGLEFVSVAEFRHVDDAVEYMERHDEPLEAYIEGGTYGEVVGHDCCCCFPCC